MAGYMLLGATWLIMKTEGALQDRIGKLGAACGMASEFGLERSCHVGGKLLGRRAPGENAREQRILLILPGFSHSGTGTVCLIQSGAKILRDHLLCIGPLAVAE